MNTLEQFKQTLIPVLELTSISHDEYLIIGSAAEFYAGLGVVFGDVDIIVSEETFKKVIGLGLTYVIQHETSTPTRVIRVGLVDIIEHKGEWLNKPRREDLSFPILPNKELIEWRIWMGRPKDQLKAFQLCQHIYASIRSIVLSNPPFSVNTGLSEVEKMIFNFQQRLMEMRK